MIYTIGVCGLLQARFSAGAGTMTANGPRDSREWPMPKPGRYVWQTYEEAADAARYMEELTKRQEGRETLTQNQTWLIMGVDADWNFDTKDAPGEWPEFPTARQLRFDKPMIEIEQRLPL